MKKEGESDSSLSCLLSFFPGSQTERLFFGREEENVLWPGITLLSSHSSFMPHPLSLLPALLSHCYLCLRRLEQEFLSPLSLPLARGDLPRACIRSRDRMSTKRRMSEAARKRKKKTSIVVPSSIVFVSRIRCKEENEERLRGTILRMLPFCVDVDMCSPRVLLSCYVKEHG